jgi:hypothetical protein
MRTFTLTIALLSLLACSKKDNSAPEFASVIINGSNDHPSLFAGQNNTVTIALQDEALFQLRCTFTKQGSYANHDAHTTDSYFGMLIPNHGEFKLDSVRNLNGTSESIDIVFPVTAENSGLWTMQLQALDEEGNLQTMVEDVMINSSIYPSLSITMLGSDVSIGDGKLTAAANTPWNWQGDIYDLDTLDYVHITVTQNGDTISSYIQNDPSTWTLDLHDNFPMQMPSTAGTYQFLVRMGDIDGNETWRSSRLIVE